MPTKSEQYLEQYSAAARASRTYDAVVRDIRDERQQLQALQQLIASERNALVQLENAYDPDKTQDTIADEVLRATYSSEALAAQLAAQTKAAGAAATAVPKAIVDTVNQGEGGAAATNRAGLLAVSMLRNRDRPMTQQAADADARVSRSTRRPLAGRYPTTRPTSRRHDYRPSDARTRWGRR